MQSVSETKKVCHIETHPVLGPLTENEKVTFYYNGMAIEALKGDTVAGALTSLGIRTFRYSRKRHDPRGLFCGIGHCQDCVMTVNGVPGVKTCQTLIEDGMIVESES